MPDWRAVRRHAWLSGLLLFAAAMLHASFHSELMYDDAYNASVAKNLALGKGWVSSYDSPVWFNPRVTTGPSLIVPLAILTPIIGNPEWLPSVTATSLMLLALLACLITIRQLLEGDQFPWVVLAILLLLSLYDRNSWQVFIGDGLLALTLGWVFLRSGPLLLAPAPRTGILLGAVTAIALLCKLYALIAACALPTVWLLAAIQRNQLQHRPYQLVAGGFLIGALAVLLPWWLYQYFMLAQLAPEQQALRQQVAAEFVAGGSGIGALLTADNLWSHLGSNISRNFELMTRWLNLWGQGSLLAAALLVGIPGCLLQLLLRGNKTALQWSLLSLGLGILAHLSWLLLFAHGPWVHYIRVPIILSLIFLPLYLSQYLPARAIAAAAAVLILLLPTEQRQQWLTFASFNNSPAATSLARIELVERLRQEPTKLPLAGCGWLVLRALEYQLPGSGHMVDCMLLVQQQLRAQGVSPEQTFSEPLPLAAPVRFVIPTYMLRWNWAGRGHRVERDMIGYCPDSIWRNEFYELRECSVKQLAPATATYINQYRFQS